MVQGVKSKRGSSALSVKSVISAAVVIAIVALSVYAVNFALYPYGSKSEVMWSEYRNEDSINAVCLGSSLAARSFDPSVLDERLGIQAFNMATPSQDVRESALGLEEALSQHEIDTVFYGIDFSAFWEEGNMYPGRVFLREKWKGDSLQRRLSDMSFALADGQWLLDEKSINWLFPWTEQRVSFGNVASNVKLKAEGAPVVQAAEVIENGWRYQGEGYGNYDGVCDYNADNQVTFSTLGIVPLRQDKIDHLGAMIDRARASGAEFIAYMPPLSDFALIDMAQSYADFSRQFAEIVEAHGGRYYDFNLAKPELFESRESYFFDFEHCNFSGATALSTALAQVVGMQRAGEDASALFMTFDEKLASINRVSIAKLDCRMTSDGIRLKASCLAGSGVKPEYQFLASADGGDYVVIQDYSESDSCVFLPEGQGACCVRVNVRQQGDDAAFEKHTQHRVVYSRALQERAG